MEIRVGDRVRFNGVLIGVEGIDEGGSRKALLIHGSIDGESSIFYLAVDDIDRYISRGLGITLSGVGTVSSIDPLVIEPIEVSGV